jgi:hypothetical protein
LIVSSLKVDRLAKALHFAKSCGKNGFLMVEIADYLAEGKDVAAGIVNRLVTRGNIKTVGHRIVERGPFSRKIRVSVYRFMHDFLPAIEKITNPQKPKNVFEFIEIFGHDEDWVPEEPEEATSALPGSHGKIEVLCQRIERGEDLFHECDPRGGHARCEPLKVCHT